MRELGIAGAASGGLLFGTVFGGVLLRITEWFARGPFSPDAYGGFCFFTALVGGVGLLFVSLAVLERKKVK